MPARHGAHLRRFRSVQRSRRDNCSRSWSQVATEEGHTRCTPKGPLGCKSCTKHRTAQLLALVKLCLPARNAAGLTALASQALTVVATCSTAPPTSIGSAHLAVTVCLAGRGEGQTRPHVLIVVLIAPAVRPHLPTSSGQVSCGRALRSRRQRWQHPSSASCCTGSPTLSGLDTATRCRRHQTTSRSSLLAPTPAWSFHVLRSSSSLHRGVRRHCPPARHQPVVAELTRVVPPLATLMVMPPPLVS